MIKGYQLQRKRPPSSREPEKEIGKLKKNENVTEIYHLLSKNLSRVYNIRINEVGKQILNFSCFSKGYYDINQQKRLEIKKQATKMNENVFLTNYREVFNFSQK